MNLVRTSLEGVFVIEPRIHEDHRGRFTTHFERAWFRDHGLNADFDKAATSRNLVAGTLRGMHWQESPHGETKLVRCCHGAIHDVALDLRRGSPTFGKWFSTELSADNERSLYIPEGCAHGFQTLCADSHVIYQISGEYAPRYARGVRWDDPAFGIQWPECEARVLSQRDSEYPNYLFD